MLPIASFSWPKVQSSRLLRRRNFSPHLQTNAPSVSSSPYWSAIGSSEREQPRDNLLDNERFQLISKGPTKGECNDSANSTIPRSNADWCFDNLGNACDGRGRRHRRSRFLQARRWVL